jgi:uncharacterized membrane protein
MNSPWQSLVFWLAAIGCELGYRYAWSAFALNTIDHRVYPLALAIEVLVAAILVTLLVRAQHTPPRPALALHACCVLFYMVRNAHDLEMPDRQFWYLLWVLDFAARPHSGHAWFALIATCAWTLAFWIAGHRLVSGSQTYLAVCARFDRGLGWLFALLFAKLLLRYEPDVDVHERVSDGLVFPYFVLGITSVALARSRSDVRTRFIGGNRGLGLILGFAGAVSVGAVALLMVCLPYLRSASEAGYASVVEAGGPFGGTIAEFLIFVFGSWFKFGALLIDRPASPNSGSADLPSAATSDGGPHGAPSNWHAAWWLALLALVVAVAVVSVAWKRIDFRQLMAAVQHWLAASHRWLGQLRARIALWWARRDHEAIQLYRGLLRWGRRSGLPRRPSETPLEYGQRLQRSVRAAASAIEPIVLAFNAHVYGPERCDVAALARARQALSRLRSPRLWASRAASWLRGEDGVSPSER